MPRSPDPGPAIPEGLLRDLAPQVLGALVRGYGHFDLAEDAVQEALLAASMQWPSEGMPENPRGWLIRVASRRLTDLLRSEQARRRREHTVAEHTLPEDWYAAAADRPEPGDDSLLLLFLCCHPSLPTASQIALTLRAVGGLTTTELARAFMTSEATMTRRISRAKQTLAAKGATFSLPPPSEQDARLRSVLHVLYLMFNEGYVATVGPSLQRRELAEEAIRLTRTLHRIVPDAPEISDLLALMLLIDARRAARTDAEGLPVPMADQDRTLWDAEKITEGVRLISEALPSGPVGPYQLQAAIAAVHDEAPSWEATDWPQIEALYRLLIAVADRPLVRLNHAVAVAMTHGPDAGLALADQLAVDGSLAGDHRLHAVRAHLLESAGQPSAAAHEYVLAAQAATSLPQQRYLNRRAQVVRDRNETAGIPEKSDEPARTADHADPRGPTEG